jgi:hypothetical protein
MSFIANTICADLNIKLLSIDQTIQLVNHLNKFVDVVGLSKVNTHITDLLTRLDFLFKKQFQTSASEVMTTLNSLPESVVKFLTKDLIPYETSLVFNKPLEILAYNNRHFIIRHGPCIQIFDTNQSCPLGYVTGSYDNKSSACFSSDGKSFAISQGNKITFHEISNYGFNRNKMIELASNVLSIKWIGNEITFISDKCFGLINLETNHKTIYDKVVDVPKLKNSFEIDSVTYSILGDKLIMESSRLDFNLFNSLFHNIDLNNLTEQMDNCTVFKEMPAMVRSECYQILNKAKDDVVKNKVFFERL